MLTLTQNANQVVKAIVEQSGAGDEAGLRISQDTPDSPALEVVPAESPMPGDRIVEEETGARVFLEETASVTLDDKVLDALVDEAGGVQFSIAPQG